MKYVEEVTSQNFEQEVLKSENPVLVDFWAEWCEPCKALAPKLEEIAEENQNKVKIVKLNVEGESELAAKYHVREFPH